MAGAINMDRLQEMEEEYEKEGGSSGDLFLNQKDIDGEMDIRILPPLGNMNGIYFLREIALWINKKKYISPETFGEDCPMREEIEKAKDEKDEDILDIMKSEALNGDLNKLFSANFLIPVLVMQEDNKGRITDEPEDQVRILQCTKQLFLSINKLVTHRNYQGNDWDITHPKKGFNITVMKERKGDRNSYSAIPGKQVEMPDWVEDPENLVDIVTMEMNQMKSDDYLRSVVRNWLYGEDSEEDEARYSQKEIQESLKLAGKTPKEEGGSKKKGAGKGEKKRSSSGGGKSQKEREKDFEEEGTDKEEESPEEEEEEKPKKKGKKKEEGDAPKKSKKKEEEPEDDEEEGEEEGENEEEEEAPKKKPKKEEKSSSKKKDDKGGVEEDAGDDDEDWDDL